MKRLITLIWLGFLSLNVIYGQSNQSNLFEQIDGFLKKYVHDGLIEYAAIKKNPEALNGIVTKLETFDLTELRSQKAEKAFWLNAYNMLVIDGIVDQYPINSPMDIPGFFDRQKRGVAGKNLTLNEIENDKVRKQFGDARIHFALVCAALSCPQIIPQAYVPNKLDQQLDKRTHVNLNDDTFIRVDEKNKSVLISKIFDWYEEDFVTDKQTVLDYINRYREKEIPDTFEVGHYEYDWRLNEYRNGDEVGYFLLERKNLQAYTASTLLRPNEVEVKSFNNLYTQTAFFNADGDKVDSNARSTFFTNITSFMFGLKPNFNFGLDVYFKSVRNGSSSSSPLSVFQFGTDNNSRAALTAFAPKVKVSPFSGLRNFAVQTLVLIPLANDLNEQPFVDHDDPQWWTQLFFDNLLSQHFLLYLENGWFFRFDADETVVTTPTKAILNYYPSDKWTIYLPTELAPTWDGFAWSAYYFQAGLGAKYQIKPYLELEALYTKFLTGQDQGAGVTYNLGIRLIE